MMAPIAYELCPANDDAAEQLSQLGTVSFLQAYADTHSAANLRAYCSRHYSVEKVRSLLLDPHITCRIAYRAAEPVGFYVMAHRSSPPDFPSLTCELKQIYVVASEYGRGLGQRLYRDAIASAKTLDVDAVWLCVSALNHRAQAFYRKLGFVERGAGPVLEVGSDRLNSNILSIRI